MSDLIPAAGAAEKDGNVPLDSPAKENNAVSKALDAPVAALESSQPPVSSTLVAAEPMTALQHVEAWWAELKASAPSPHQLSFDEWAKKNWHKLVNRLEGK